MLKRLCCLCLLGAALLLPARPAVPEALPVLEVRAPAPVADIPLPPDRLVRRLERALHDSGRFQVVTVQHRALPADHALSLSALAGALPDGPAAVPGGLLLLPTVVGFHHEPAALLLPDMDGRFTLVDQARLDLVVEVVEAASRRILASHAVSGTARGPNAPDNAPPPALVEAVLDDATAHLLNRLVDQLAPMRVVQVQDRLLYLNRGADGGLRPGDALLLYRPGPVRRDPQTGEGLGRLETGLGMARVVRIDAQVTVAELVGTPGGIILGDHARLMDRPEP